jgi:hypothetical protein
MCFAITGLLAHHRRPHIRFLFIGSHFCSALLSGPLRGGWLFSRLRFAITSPLSTCEEGSHLQAVEHAGARPKISACHTIRTHICARP